MELREVKEAIEAATTAAENTGEAWRQIGEALARVYQIPGQGRPLERFSLRLDPIEGMLVIGNADNLEDEHAVIMQSGELAALRAYFAELDREAPGLLDRVLPTPEKEPS